MVAVIFCLLYNFATDELYQDFSEIADNIYSKTCVERPLSKRQKIVFQYQLSLYAGLSIAECSKESVMHTFRPSSRYHLSLRPLFVYFVAVLHRFNIL